MKNILFVILLLVTVPTCFAANVYIDPSATYNGNGTAGIQAVSAGSVGAYNTWASVTFNAANDYYQKCDTTFTSTAHWVIRVINIVGTSSNRVILGSYYLNNGNEVTGISGAKPIIKKNDMVGNIIVIKDNSTYITIKNLDLRRGAVCIYGVDADYLLIQNNDIGEGSKWGIRLHGANKQLYGTDIKNNTIDSHKLTYGQIAETDLWDAIQIVGSANYYSIYNNIIKDFGHDGILLAGYTSGLTVKDNDIYNNYIDGTNTEHLRFGSTIGRYCTDNKFHNNYAENLNAAFQMAGYRNELYYNIISNVRDSGITSSGAGIILNSGMGNDSTTSYNKVYNNIIYKTDNEGIAIRMGTNGVEDVEYNEITNNIILNTGNCYSITGGCDRQQSAGTYIWGGTYVAKNNIWKDNIVYTAGKTTNLVVYKPTPTSGVLYYDNVAEWNATNGTHGQIITGNIGNDPELIDPENGNFCFSLTSPYINSGIGIPANEIIGTLDNLPCPNADINNDGKVNIEDFAVLAAWWDDENACSSPDWCGGGDFDMSETIDMFDLAYFVENWLW